MKKGKSNKAATPYTLFFKENTFPFIKVMSISLVSYSFTLLIPLFLQNITDQVSQGAENISISYIYISLFVMVLFFVIDIVKNRQVTYLSKVMDEFVYVRVIKKLFRIPYKFFMVRNSSDLLYRLNLIKTNRDYLIEQIMTSLFSLLNLFVILFILLIVDLKSSIYIIAITIMLSIVVIIMKNRIVTRDKKEILLATKLQGKEYEFLNSMFTLKATGMEDFVRSVLLNSYADSLKAFEKRNNINADYSTVISTFSQFIPIFISAVVFYTSGVLSAGNFVFIYTLIGYYLRSLSDVYSSFALYGTLQNNIERIQDILEFEEENKNENLIEIKKIDKITFENVWYRHAGEKKYILKNINLDIHRGEKVGIVGRTGVGKSTLISLALGMIQPNEGNIYINDINIKNIDLKKFKKNIGVVPQEHIMIKSI